MYWGSKATIETLGLFTVGIFWSFFILFFSHSHDSHYFSLLFSFILIFSLSPLGLFTVAILGPFSGHFQTHFQVIFEYLAEEQTKSS